MDFQKHIQKAEEAVRRRNYDYAVELYRQLLDLDPDQGEARAGLRVALQKRHEGRRGGKLLRAVGGAAPLVRAKTMAKLGKHEACAKALEDFLATNPVHEEANLLLGNALEQGEHYRSARAVYEFLAEIAPRSPEGLKRAGAMLQRTGEPLRALEYYERALEADPRDQEALKARKNLAAEAAMAQTDLEGAGHSRERMASKTEADALERTQRMHLSEEDLQKQLVLLEERFAESPSDPDLMVRLADVHERLGDPGAALDFVERALSYRQDSYDLLTRAGALQTKTLKKAIARADKLGEREEADRLEQQLADFEVEDAQRRLVLRPGDNGLRLVLGRRLIKQGLHDEALAELQKAHDDPRVARDVHFLMAQCFQAKGFKELATKEYERALDGTSSVDERAKEILYNLGAIAEDEGGRDTARAHYTRIFEVDIGYRDVAQKMESLK